MSARMLEYREFGPFSRIRGVMLVDGKERRTTTFLFVVLVPFMQQRVSLQWQLLIFDRESA